MEVIIKLWEFKNESESLVVDGDLISLIPTTNNYIEIKNIVYKVATSVFFDKAGKLMLPQCSEHILVSEEDYENEISERYFLLECYIKKPELADFVVEQEEETPFGIMLCAMPVSVLDYFTNNEEKVCSINKIINRNRQSIIKTDGCNKTLSLFRTKPFFFTGGLTKR